MRRNFVQILREAKIDIYSEYTKLYNWLFGKRKFIDSAQPVSYYEMMSAVFSSFRFCGTCESLEEFDEMHGFRFDMNPQDFNTDYLIGFCEYVFNIVNEYNHLWGIGGDIDTSFLFRKIGFIIESLGYMKLAEDEFTIFVAKSPAAISVAEIVPAEISYKVIFYNHHSLAGDIEGKKEIILKLANILEGKREDLKAVNATLEKDLFYLFNNLNIRHNNTDPNISKFRQEVALMSQTELEHWYDETYQMCLLAFLEIEHKDRKQDFDKLKNRIENNK